VRKIDPILIGILAFGPATAFACATCGCSLSSDAATGYAAQAGWQVSFEYDFLNQNQLRSGYRSTSQSQVAQINDAGGSQEVENQTINRYMTLGIAYAPSADWNFKLLIPYIDRSHSTYGNATNPISGNGLSSASIDGLGDTKLIASYQGLLATHNFGLQLGVKLPTGDYGGQNTATNATVGHPANFSAGPNAGSPVDTSLQPGTGSTDIILGAYYYQPISQNLDAFINGQFQAAVMEKLDQANQDFRPGNTMNLSVGLRYEADPAITPQLQINLTRKSHDQGALADESDTAGTVAYLSPGVTFRVFDNQTHVYSFVQLPVYSNLQGYQLFPRWTASVGITHAF
jgi:hypothetical protein